MRPGTIFEFHAASWLDAASQWHQGTFFPRWTEWANHGFGEPRFIFYPPLSWLLGAALGSLVPWNAVPGVFIVLVQTIAGVSAFALARALFPRRSALFCAACYAANPYALLVVYVRSDFAEQLAMAFLPLLALYGLKIAGILPVGRRGVGGANILFAVFFAAVWLSNAPAGVMASYGMSIVFLWSTIRKRSVRPLQFGATGIIIGFALATFYLLPAAYEQRWVNINQVLSSGLLPSQNFLYTMTDDPEHTLFNWIASSSAVSMVVLTLISALAAYRRPGDKIVPASVSQQGWQAMLVITAISTIFMLRFSAGLWSALPKLRFLQFPWRWMAILGVPFAYFVAATVARRRGGWVWGIAILAGCGACGAFLVQQTWWDTEDIPVLQEAIHSGKGFDGVDEYDPIGDDHYNIPEQSPQLRVVSTENEGGHAVGAVILVEQWKPEFKQLKVLARRPTEIALRLLNYPSWQVQINGISVTAKRGEEIDQMVVAVGAGESLVQVRFLRTWDRTLGAGISLLTLMGLAIWLAMNSGAGKAKAKSAGGLNVL